MSLLWVFLTAARVALLSDAAGDDDVIINFPPECGGEWQLIDLKCYRTSANNKNISAAQTKCESGNATLMRPWSNTSFLNVFNGIAPTTETFIFTGLTQAPGATTKYDGWYWFNGTEQNGPEIDHWCPEEPTSGRVNGESLAAGMRHTNAWCLADVPDGWERKFICEKSPYPDPFSVMVDGHVTSCAPLEWRLPVTVNCTMQPQVVMVTLKLEAQILCRNQKVLMKRSSSGCKKFETCALIGGDGMSTQCEYRCRCGGGDCQLTFINTQQQPIRVCEIEFDQQF